MLFYNVQTLLIMQEEVLELNFFYQKWIIEYLTGGRDCSNPVSGEADNVTPPYFVWCTTAHSGLLREIEKLVTHC